MGLRELTNMLQSALDYLSTAEFLPLGAGGPPVHRTFNALGDEVEAAKGAWPSARAADKTAVVRLVVAVGEALGELDGKISAAMAASPRVPANMARVSMMLQLGSAFPVMRECCRLAGLAGLAPDDATRFASCCRLLTGASSLAVLIGWHVDVAPRLHQQAAQAEAAQAAQGLSKQSWFEASGVHLQLQAAHALLGWLSSRQEEPGLATFASRLSPADMQRWLNAVISVLAAGQEADCHQPYLKDLALACAPLLTHPAFERHQAAVLAARQLQGRLAALLPDLALVAAFAMKGSCSSGSGLTHGSSSSTPTAGGGSSAAAEQQRTRQAAESILQLLVAPCLQPAVLGRGMPVEGNLGVSFGYALNKLLQSLPAERPAGWPAQRYAALLLQAVTAAGRPSRELLADWNRQRQHSMTPATTAMVHGSFLAALAVGILPELARALLLLLCDAEAAVDLAALPPGDVKAACQAAGDTRELAGLGLSAFEEHVRSQLSSGSGGGGGSGGGSSGAASVLSLTELLAKQVAASLAAMRLAHFGAELAQRVGTPATCLPAGFAEDCLRSSQYIAFRMCGLVRDYPAALSRGDELRQHAVPSQLRLLHSVACRMAHRCACAPLQRPDAAPVLASTHAIGVAGLAFRAVCELMKATEEDLFERGVGAGIAVAAVQVHLLHLRLLLRDSDPYACCDAAEFVGAAVEGLVLADLFGAVPTGADAPERQALMQALRMQLQAVERCPRAPLDNASFTLRHAAQHADLAAALAGSGVLGELLRATLGNARVQMGADQIDRIHRSTYTILAGLVASGKAAVDSPASHASPAAQETAQEVAAAGAALEAALSAVPEPQPYVDASAPRPQTAQLYVAQLEPAAVRLAQALDAWSRASGAHQQQLLELAQAAATRSCAYLCCTNVGALGGPGAGEQPGSQRCSACRAVWYCGTACSHADWKQGVGGGHKRLCKALAAARQQEKAQRRAAGAAP